MVSEAKKVLIDFIIAMNLWELKYTPLVRDNGMLSIKEKMRDDLNEIFDKFCTKRERKWGRQFGLSCGEPPDYSPDEEIISLSQSESKNKVTIHTQQHTKFKNQCRYTLHFKKNEWRIDKKEWFNSSESKWEKDDL